MGLDRRPNSAGRRLNYGEPMTGTPVPDAILRELTDIHQRIEAELQAAHEQVQALYGHIASLKQQAAKV